MRLHKIYIRLLFISSSKIISLYIKENIIKSSFTTHDIVQLNIQYKKDTRICRPSQELFVSSSRKGEINQTKVCQILQDSQVQCLIVNITAYRHRTQGQSLLYSLPTSQINHIF